ncbi:Predicted dehydrogenase [Saccharicrinis carchari]|uniref:Predicted dehydrogenase n=1 Tax=Saccharicrinis carchari TaxID=1168039 RepID=A0A521B1I6_SACCC|nr:Gfo/Idh/MocA family oxidoreductase [Saccharicrinis carchari]SMO40919.1 Predicted dehydrogenase [Saccharicrinis carchari]
MESIKKINVGVVGFGLSGRVFHSPFIHTNPHFNLSVIVSSKNDAREIYPDVEIIRDFDDLLKREDIELVIVSTPNQLHFEQAKKALEAGKHVIVEKPIAPSSNEVLRLIEIARRCNKKLLPYHNLRWNGDARTVKQILKDNLLGEVWDCELHFDRFVPEIKGKEWKYGNPVGGGTLYDLGVHLIDQAVDLFGKPEAVFCRLFNQRMGSAVDDSFDLKLIYPLLNVTLKAGVFVKEQGPRIAIHGKKGSFVKYGIDPQEAILRNGGMPIGDDWGKQPEEDWGILNTQINGLNFRGKVETQAGNYHSYFNDVYHCIVDDREPAVTPEQAYLNILIIEKAIESHEKMQVVKL